MTIRTALREALLLTAVAIAAALAVNGLRPDGLELVAGVAAVAPGRLISIDEARQAHTQGRALFADARSAADFAAGHIEGAVSLPEHDLDAWAGAFIARTDPGTAIITYCDGAGCPLARSLAEKLVELGFADTRYLNDGWGKWREQGLPVAAGN
jgi:rhodanese-related sulfurtransferase